MTAKKGLDNIDTPTEDEIEFVMRRTSEPTLDEGGNLHEIPDTESHPTSRKVVIASLKVYQQRFRESVSEWLQ